MSKSKSGWAKVWRVLRHHKYFKTRPMWVKLFFVHMILDVCHEDHEIEWRGYRIFLKRGQFALSMRQACEEYGVSERMFRYWINDLCFNKILKCETLFYSSNSGKNDVAGLVAGRVAGLVAGRVAGQVPGGTLVTVLNYCKWQDPKDEKKDPDVAGHVAGHVAGRVAGRVALTKNGYTEEWKEQEEKDSEIVFQKLSPEKLIEIWNEDCGPLAKIQAVSPALLVKLQPLVDYFNDQESCSEDQCRKFVRVCAATHPEHRSLMCPDFFAKDLNHINQLLRDVYNKPWKETHSGRAKESRLSVKGSDAKFKGKLKIGPRPDEV